MGSHSVPRVRVEYVYLGILLDAPLSPCFIETCSTVWAMASNLFMSAPLSRGIPVHVRTQSEHLVVTVQGRVTTIFLDNICPLSLCPSQNDAK